MKQEIAKKWVKALRSGKYRKGKGALCDEGKYCCLGVLCELAIKDGVKLDKQDTVYGMRYDGESGVAPKKVKRYIGGLDKKITNPKSFRTESVQEVLIDLNDIEQLSFKKIADFIEKTFLKKKKTTKKPSSK